VGGGGEMNVASVENDIRTRPSSRTEFNACEQDRLSPQPAPLYAVAPWRAGSLQLMIQFH